MKRVIFNQKGGVGKSTLSVNLAAQNALCGHRTLLVDLDSQGNSTRYVGVDGQLCGNTVADMFKQVAGWFSSPKPAHAFVHPTVVEHLDVLPAHPSLAQIEHELESRYKMFKLKEALTTLSTQYHSIYIDTPPNFNFYSKAALIAADRFLVPFDCDDFSAMAIDRLLSNVLELKQDHNAELVFEGVIVNQFNPQAQLPKTLIQMLKDKDLPVLAPYIGSSVKVKESHSARIPMVAMAPGHKVSKQLLALYHTLQATPPHP